MSLTNTNPGKYSETITDVTIERLSEKGGFPGENTCTEAHFLRVRVGEVKIIIHNNFPPYYLLKEK